jgi:hypothetical protein
MAQIDLIRAATGLRGGRIILQLTCSKPTSVGLSDWISLPNLYSGKLVLSLVEKLYRIPANQKKAKI